MPKLLGADPEFLLIHNGKTHKAIDHVSNEQRTERSSRAGGEVPTLIIPEPHARGATTCGDPEYCGCNDCIRRRLTVPPAPVRDYPNKFGYDGAGIAAEIRPDPSYSPTVLVKNIREALLEGRKLLKDNYEWYAGTGEIGNHPTGGHLHLGINDYSKSKLDIYIGIPLIALEPHSGRKYRRSNGYGNWEDCRTNSWGVEYRTPSSWLVSPAITGIAAALAWLVARNWRELPLPTWCYERFKYSFESTREQAGFQKWLSKRSIEVLGELKNLNDYKKVSGLLEPYKFISNIIGDWQEDRNILDTWHLRRAVDKRSIFSVKEEVAEAGSEILEGEKRSSIIWNRNDANMSDVEAYCGKIQSAGYSKLWAVGAKKKRGSNLLLSPSLMHHKRVLSLLAKHKLEYCEWPDFPERNGELVLGLPLEYRRDCPNKCGQIIRLVALTVFDRLQEKG